MQSLSFRHPPLFAACLLMLFGLAHEVAAQSPDKILKQAAKAMGGESALRRASGREAKGTITRTRDDARGVFQMLAMKPDLYVMAFEVGGFETAEGCNGKSAWRRDSRAGLRTLAGEESAQLRAEAAFRNHLWLNYQKEKSKLADAGQETVNGKPARAIVLTTSRGVKIKLWFDDSSRLLVKEEMPASEGARVFEYADHRAVDGVMEPFSIKLTAGDDGYEIRLSEITHNKPADRARFDFPKTSAEPLPDIAALLREVVAHQEEIEKLQERYACTAVVTQREPDKQGGWRVKETHAFDVSFYRGRKIRRQTAKNNQPLSAQDQAEEDRRIEKLIREIDRREAAGNQTSGIRKMGPPDPAARGQSISAILRTSRLANARRERYRGRDVIVFDFEPQPGYKPTTAAETFLSKGSGVVWIDAAARQVVRADMRLDNSVSIGGGLVGAVKSGATFIREQSLVTIREGGEFWLPTYAETNIPVRAMFFGITISSVVRYGDYRQFDVEAEKEKLKPPPKPE